MYRVHRQGNDLLVETPRASARRIVRLSGVSIDRLFRSEDPLALIEHLLDRGVDESGSDGPPGDRPCDAPVASQEIWAAGVTYLRSRTARMEESESSGGDRFYDLVYEAERPELFFKATARRVRGHRHPVRIRADSRWDVPEPELALAVNAAGRIFGYCIGNDMSSRDIEGSNPLYLPQAKIYTGSCALGPRLTLTDAPIPRTSAIRLAVLREGRAEFEGETALDRMKRTPEELVDFLFRENDFPDGAVLLTGTGVVPPAGFTLHHGDEIRIAIDGLGELVNVVE